MIRSSFAVVALLLSMAYMAQSQMCNLNCALVVPPNALTATGLATPFQLKAFNPANGPCNMANPNQQSFVQGVILDLETGNLFVYNPLVIDAGSTPAITPTAPVLPVSNVIALWFGTNANTLQLLPTPTATLPDSLQQANCVMGVLSGNMTDLFGQVSYCNAPAFFQSARMLVTAGMIKIPALGTALDGHPCPTLRDFSVVDQDQSDNDVTSYLLVVTATTVNGARVPAGTTAQNTAANRALLGTNAMVINNASDNILLTLMDAQLGCTPFMAPDLADNSNPIAAVGLSELSALYNQAQPMAQVPSGDPMVTDNGATNINKINAYRVGMGQAAVTQLTDADTTTYCQALGTIAPPRFMTYRQFLINGASPTPTLATNLWGFVVQRFVTTWGAGGLNCQGLLGLPSPVTQIFNGQGITSDGTVTTLGNIIPSSAFAAGGQFSAVASTVNPGALTMNIVGTPVVIGLAVALGVVILIDVIVLIWYLMTRGGSSGANYTPKSSYNPAYDTKIAEQPSSDGNYPLTPIGGIGGANKGRESMFMRMRQWV